MLRRIRYFGEIDGQVVVKKAALAVFGIFGLAVVALVVIPYLIDLNNYKREIAAEPENPEDGDSG